MSLFSREVDEPFVLTEQHVEEMSTLGCAAPTCHGCHRGLKVGAVVVLARLELEPPAPGVIRGIRASLCARCWEQRGTPEVKERILTDAAEKKTRASPGFILFEDPTP